MALTAVSDLLEEDAYGHYQASYLGQSLLEALDNLVQSKDITGAIASRTVRRFDQIIAEVIANEDFNKSSIKVTGHLDYYNEVFPVYTFMVENAVIHFGPERKKSDGRPGKTIQVPGKLMITACKSAKPDEEEGKKGTKRNYGRGD